MTKTFKVAMLPTEKATSLHIIRSGSLVTVPAGESPNTGQHLYIISDDEIKEGDWFIYNNFSIKKCVKVEESLIHSLGLASDAKSLCKKIIATTDKSLTVPYMTNYGTQIEVGGINQIKELPQIPESFIQVYIKAYNDGKPITEVDLEIVIGQGNEDGQTTSIKEHIKTRPDNTVIVHQSKMYSRSEVVAYVGNALNAITKELGVKYPQGFLTKWIQDNLK